MKSSRPMVSFVSVPIAVLPVGAPLPCDLFLCLNHKMVKYRPEGTSIDSETFDKMIQTRVLLSFIDAADADAFYDWVDRIQAQEKKELSRHITSENKGLMEAIQGQRRAMLEIFTKMELHSDDIQYASSETRKLVAEIMQRPQPIKMVQLVQAHVKGIVDHSVNVAVLGTYVCHRMGYNHQQTLETISLAGLLHDYGLLLAHDGDRGADRIEQLDANIHNPEHPAMGSAYFAKMPSFPELLPLLVAQHHEYLDGSGYPRGLAGTSIHELSRILCIVNLFDELVQKSTAPTIELRSQEALVFLERNYEGKLDRKNLPYVISILRSCLSKKAAA